MFTRRFVFLVGVLATLNLVLWFAGPGLALRKALVAELFGPNMIRAEVITRTPVCGSTDCHIDRGVITQVTTTQITLKEADGRIQPITIASTTVVLHLGRQLPLTRLAKKWRVTVTWPATGAAQWIDVDKIPPRKKAG
jgi:hypothetical protein